MRTGYIVTHKLKPATQRERERNRLSASREVYRELLRYMERKRAG